MLSYFDLFHPKPAQLNTAPSLAPVWRQFIIYGSVIAGILVLPLIQNAALAVPAAFSLRNILIALVVGLGIFPTAYRSAFDPNSPLLSQAGVAIMTGFGWENLLHAAVKATGQ
ncbi:MAG: hypothetical protein JO136_12855 [Hyphomicrobiales bacterium]|nr:hypothetical protein [Hyphomicrobiales bacterium]MBV9909687.1 hypothetical protein [Hyphomicrobiales bacterium]